MVHSISNERIFVILNSVLSISILIVRNSKFSKNIESFETVDIGYRDNLILEKMSTGQSILCCNILNTND